MKLKKHLDTPFHRREKGELKNPNVSATMPQKGKRGHITIEFFDEKNNRVMVKEFNQGASRERLSELVHEYRSARLFFGWNAEGSYVKFDTEIVFDENDRNDFHRSEALATDRYYQRKVTALLEEYRHAMNELLQEDEP